jgi:hypothetical protein
MENVKRVRIVKRGGATTAGASAGAGGAGGAAAARAEREARREARDVVSDWVRDHRLRAEEFRENYSALLDRLGFTSPLSCRTTRA